MWWNNQLGMTLNDLLPHWHTKVYMLYILSKFSSIRLQIFTLQPTMQCDLRWSWCLTFDPTDTCRFLCCVHMPVWFQIWPQRFKWDKFSFEAYVTTWPWMTWLQYVTFDLIIKQRFLFLIYDLLSNFKIVFNFFTWVQFYVQGYHFFLTLPPQTKRGILTFHRPI